MIEFNKRNFRNWFMMGINPCIWSVALPEIMTKKNNVVALTADLARYSGMQRFMQNYPDNFYNFGIAEQDMVGAAAGMALEGDEVYMTTYAPFMSFRCADQLRHLIGNYNLNVTSIGSAAGLTASGSGESLMAINDIALMRSINNMTVLSPADCTEMIKMMLAVSNMDTPVYIRFCGAVGLPIIYQEDYDFEIGKAVTLQEGDKVAIVATGTTIVSECLKAAKLIKEQNGVKVGVYNFHTIKPIDEECIEELSSQYDWIVTVEEHSIFGGLGGAVAEVLTSCKGKAKQLILGIKDGNHPYGNRDYALEKCGLKAEGIYQSIVEQCNF